MTPIRLRAVGGFVAALLVFACAACSNTDDEVRQVTVNYLLAVDQGDAAKRCELQTLGVTDNSRCLDLAQSNGGTNSFQDTPEVVRVESWSTKGKLVVAKVSLKANPDARRFIAVTLHETDGHWLVDDDAWVSDPNDDASIAKELS